MPRHADDMNELDYARAVVFCAGVGDVSKGRIQHQLGIGFNAAARLVEMMIERGFCQDADSIGRHEINL